MLEVIIRDDSDFRKCQGCYILGDPLIIKWTAELHVWIRPAKGGRGCLWKDYWVQRGWVVWKKCHSDWCIWLIIMWLNWVVFFKKSTLMMFYCDKIQSTTANYIKGRPLSETDYKKRVSLVVWWQRTLLYLLADDSRLNRLWLGRVCRWVPVMLLAVQVIRCRGLTVRAIREPCQFVMFQVRMLPLFCSIKVYKMLASEISRCVSKKY